MKTWTVMKKEQAMSDMNKEHDNHEFAFARTVCSCRLCRLWCEHMPGFLVPSDLDRLIPDAVTGALTVLSAIIC